MDIISVALRLYGQAEIAGAKNNPLIVSMLKRLLSWARSDEISWCSAFVNYVAEEAGYDTEKATAAARSWLNVGEKVTTPRLGDVVIFWRVSKTDWRGHVAFYINEDEDYIYCLGGNQRDRVDISMYSKERLLGFRRLKKKKKNV